MSFQPVLPLGGLAGWKFLQRTLDTQMESHARAPQRVRATEYFREQIAEVTSASDLLADRRLREVALGAFGLQDDIDSIAFIRRVLEDGPDKEDGLPNRLSDKRYLSLAQAFDFTTGESPALRDEGFVDRIIEAYHARSFEIAVGEQDQSMRMAMVIDRDLTDILDAGRSDAASWFRVMGNPPLRKVFETALGFGSGFGALDLDQQLTQFRRRAQSIFGSTELAQFDDPETRKALTQRFLLMDQVQQSLSQWSPAAAALTLLQNANIRR
ncbi:DUF1217 domain-containing protein [Rhodobacteraceae bacterium 2376]|uniref:DUF1217 domain-containing protein n=1 Tax=Rhabdonatronobacter sediminivivens TaxID=2743469 RepID=A0A7Z0HZ67_9RHOB|nr:DUF1217 domain-containing protein [Rhabdonatronobacter sediminivivens]NYS25001.1 DUF1217 domain-containing protein [Rhabdonatronobacter sediminivivens]